MKRMSIVVTLLLALLFQMTLAKDGKYPIGKPGLCLKYTLKADAIPESNVKNVELTVGDLVEKQGTQVQWLQLHAQKVNNETFSIYILAKSYPSASLIQAEAEIERYIVSIPGKDSIEFSDQNSGAAILPNTGAWKFLFPGLVNNVNPFDGKVKKVKYLGLEYVLDSKKQAEIPSIPVSWTKVELTPDLLIGVPHNKKVKNETRRYDESDYEYIELTKDNYFEMIDHGMNVFNVNAEQVKWIENENVYYWGIGGKDITYPEHLYKSNYVGPAIFFDEPMVHVRDYIIKPKFKENPGLRKSITPEYYFEEFKHEYHEAKYERSTVRLINGLAERDDVDLGDMNFLQQNVYSWETMISSAIYQLTEGDPTTPAAIVFEPPGRLGARRVLPELNMCFDCQIPTDDPKNMIGMIKGFARGAARVADKEWGISIYGQVIRSEAYWYMTHAYDQGATRFFYWDSYQLAAVPYSEYLSLSKNLREYAKNFPRKDVESLKYNAEVAIVLPTGYNLGHVKMGIGNFSGMGELNMERKNEFGVKYRKVMNNFYTEVERCIRLGIEYDLFWGLEGLELDGYREIVTIRKDGKVEIVQNGDSQILDSARVPERPAGKVPELIVDIDPSGNSAPDTFTARANVKAGSAPVYYTQGANKEGIYRNTYVLWELYGPGEEDYTDFWNERWDVDVSEKDDTATVELIFTLDKPGSYRLRVSACDVAGRSSVVWKNITVTK